MKLYLQTQYNIVDILSNFEEVWLENGRVIAKYRRPIQPAGCVFRWAMLRAVIKGVQWGYLPDVGTSRHKLSSKLANLVFIWCMMNFCTGEIYICPIFEPNLGIIFENRGTQGSLWHNTDLLLCSDADWMQPSQRPIFNAGSYGEQEFSRSTWNVDCWKKTT